MSENMIDAAILRQPQKDDPLEVAIQDRLRDELASTQYARDFLENATNLQTSFFERAFADLDSDENIRQSYEVLISNLAEAGNSRVVSGADNLRKLPSDQGCIVITNHLGIIKLTTIDNSQQRFPVSLDEFEPFPLRHAPISIVASQLGLEIHESAVELPGRLRDIQEACGVAIVRAEGENRTQKLIEDCVLLNRQRPALIVMYPEGGTSGKRNQGGPYDLDEFRTGAFVVAAETNMPILPITQYFNPKTGFELSILEPFNVKDLKRDDLTILATETKANMQATLDVRRQP